MPTDPDLRGYAICTEPRSGSSFLGRVLSSTGVLGRPREYFNATALRAQPGFADYPEEPERQLGEIVARGVTPNGVYGVKVFCEHFDRVAETRWAGRLPALAFVHLERADLLGQAISFVRAMQTRQWTAGGPVAAEPTYNAGAIERALAFLAGRQSRWRLYFARNDLPVLRLVYEDVMASPQGAAEQVGRLLGLTETPRVVPERIGLEIQRDDLSDDWRRRFLAEARDLAVLPEVAESRAVAPAG
jgi:LPS sulfotransferase NodH